MRRWNRSRIVTAFVAAGIGVLLAAAALPKCAVTRSGVMSTTTTVPKTTTTVPSTRTPSAPAPRPTCVTTSSQNCGPYSYPADTASSGYNTYVGQDVFNPIRGWHGTLYVTDPGNWKAVENVPKGNTSVVGYPSTGQTSSGDGKSQAITAYTQITSTFAENMNANPKTDAEAAYDVWTAAGDESMIQFDFTPLRPGCHAPDDPILATVGFTEPGASTVQQWDFCKYGTERIWQLHNLASEQSGSVDIKAMLTWEINHRYLPAGAQLGLMGFGVEICSTGGVDETFQVSHFSLTALPNP